MSASEQMEAGSSPRMRGTPITTKKYGHAVGIIPAYAGNTEASVSWVCGDGDHPRVCGEHSPDQSEM